VQAGWMSVQTEGCNTSCYSVCVYIYICTCILICIVCTVVVVLCVYLMCICCTMCVLLFLLLMPDCWLEVSIQKVL